MKKRVVAERRSDCPLNATLEVLGDRWSLLIVRDLIFKGRTTYKDFLAGGKESPPTSWRTVCGAWKRKASSRRGAMQLMPGAWFTDLRQRGSLSRPYWSR